MKSLYIKGVLSVALFTLAASTQAAPVSPDEARSEAASILGSRPSWLQKAPTAHFDLQLCYTSTSAQGNCFYVFNSSKGGFAIVSADDRLPALLAFSENGNFDINRIPENMKWWLEQYQGEISAFLMEDPQISEAQARLARRAVSGERNPVSPLLKTTWDQTQPYNNLCPLDTRTGQLSVTGCVATAMAQIMKYHEWPVHPTGSNAGVTFDGTTLEWGKMLDSYADGKYSSAEANAVATLMRQCGASVNMNYSSYASGAYSFDVPEALVKYFDYNPSMEMLMRDYYSQHQWNDIVYAELAAGRPVYYCGQSSEGGHAFVCDGYLSNDMFHFNWGWSGYQDGYFRLNALNPTSGGTGSYAGGYNSDQSIITGVKKAEGETRRQQAIIANGRFVYNSDKKVFTVTGAPSGQPPLMYNPLAYSVTFNAGLRVVDAANPENVRYIKSSSKTTLQSRYGFTEMSFSISGLANGTYHLHPAFFNCYDEWQDILIPYGVQSYVTLNVQNGKYTFSNEGPDPSTFSYLIPSEPDFVGPVYAGDALSFRVTFNNVLPGDFYSPVNMLLQPVDEYGDDVVMGNHVSVAGNSSSQVMFESSVGLSEGEYMIWFSDNDNNLLLEEPFTINVLKRATNLPAPADDAEFRVASVGPAFARTGEEMGVTVRVENESSSDKTTDFVIQLLKADGLKEEASVSSTNSFTFQPGTMTTLNFAPRDFGLKAGGYYWRVLDSKGNPLSNLHPLQIVGQPYDWGNLIYEVTDEDKALARLCGSTDPDIDYAQVAGNTGKYTVNAITADALAFAEKLEKVTLPPALTIVPTASFYNAKALKYFNMRAQTPPALGQKAFSEEHIPEIVVSGPDGYTNFYAASSVWAPFRFSAWNLDFAAGITPRDMLQDAQGNVFSPYYYQADQWMQIFVDVPAGKLVHTEWTIDGQTTSMNYDGYIALPPLYGKTGSARMTLIENSAVEGLESDGNPVDVYTVQGTLILRQALPEEIARLPKGIYIAAGRRIYVK